jgi:hypothetical protein
MPGTEESFQKVLLEIVWLCANKTLILESQSKKFFHTPEFLSMSINHLPFPLSLKAHVMGSDCALVLELLQRLSIYYLGELHIAEWHTTVCQSTSGRCQNATDKFWVSVFLILQEASRRMIATVCPKGKKDPNRGRVWCMSMTSVQNHMTLESLWQICCCIKMTRHLNDPWGPSYGQVTFLWGLFKDGSSLVKPCLFSLCITSFFFHWT